MSNILRREVPLTIATIIIGLLFLDYYIFIPALRSFTEGLSDWGVLIQATAAGVGVINLMLRTTTNIQRREEYWYFDIWMIIIMIITGVTGLIGTYGTHPTYEWIIEHIYLPIDASIYAMVMFDITSAFYRTFRVRTTDSVLLFIAAFFVILKNTPLIGGLIPQLNTFGQWILDVPVLAPSRAFLFITAIGVIGFAIRAMLWKEKPTMGVTE
jgi:hypothetical protein